METYTLPPLPFSPNALEPHISKETIDFHYGKHHKAYVDKLNALVVGTKWDKQPIERIIRGTHGKEMKIFNQAAQAWNHTFYWQSLTPARGTPPKHPTGTLGQEISSAFGSFENFKNQFADAAVNHFASGWAWLIKTRNGELKIVTTHDAANPLMTEDTPLLTVDLWEHAYYIDQRNARAKYLEQTWFLLNWDFAVKNFEHQSKAA